MQSGNVYTNIEKKLILSVLKLTKNDEVSVKVARKEAKIAPEVAQNLVEKWNTNGLIYVRDKIVYVNSSKRLKLAFRAVQLGADLEKISSFLDWKEFETMAAIAFEKNGYNVKRNLRFKHAGRRWEIDIIGCKKPIVVCVDCKHWHYGMYPSAIKRVVEEQVERTSALVESLPRFAEKIGCPQWKTVKLVPAITSLITARIKFYKRVPVISILQLQDFISQLPAEVDSLKHFVKNLDNRPHRFSTLV